MADFILSEMSGLAKALYGELQSPMVSLLTDHMEAFEQEDIAKLIFMERIANGPAQIYTGLTAFDGFAPVGENGEYPKGSIQTAYEKTVRDMVWKGSMEITREMVDDNKIYDMRKKPAAFVKDFYRKKQLFFAMLLGAALRKQTSVTLNGKTFDTASADKVCAFSTAHKPLQGANISNLFSNAFSTTALNGIAAAMQNCKDDTENTLGLVPDTIIIPNDAALKADVLAVIGSELDPNTANNAMNSHYGNWNLLVWPYLNQFITAGTKPYIIMDSNYNEGADCAINQIRKELEISDDIGSKDEWIWKGYARYTGAFVDFRAMFAGGVATGTTLS